MSDDAHEMQEELDKRIPELKGTKVSGLVGLARLKKMHQEKPWLYEEEEHAVLKLAEDALKFIQEAADSHPADDMDGGPDDAARWLEEHK